MKEYNRTDVTKINQSKTQIVLESYKNDAYEKYDRIDNNNEDCFSLESETCFCVDNLF